MFCTPYYYSNTFFPVYIIYLYMSLQFFAGSLATVDLLMYFDIECSTIANNMPLNMRFGWRI
ncbi:hypothetical protein OCHUTO_0651 [Orientia chuto str. Dubai]|uniref:Uncharacterized protein n=1 Tax=Orientia chuto str. Dubai TaxID=1359168 RepID=A0A0F3MJI0_9RICK|nr:hypothetical protein OCHUTO_0651 [Orientia chuto str. Dubai]